MKTLQTTDPINLCTGNASDGKIHKSWRIYNREGNKLRTIAKMESDKLSPEIEMELANLFAAAPDLLTSLQRMLDMLEFLGLPVPEELVPKATRTILEARTTIAKARGTVPSRS